MDYSLDYAGDVPAQVGAPEPEGHSVPADARRYPRPRRRFVPSILKTGATFLIASGLFFGAEAFAPSAIRPSTLMGTYEARVQSAVKSAELTQQARYEDWAAEVRVRVAQQSEQFRAVNQSVIARYQATFDRGRMLAEATARIQSQYVGARMAQAQAMQGSDLAVVNMARLFGRIANLVDSGNGDSAMAYAGNLGNELSSELTQAATQGVTISVEGWNTGLASVEELRRDIEAVQPITIPPPPRLGPEHAEGRR
ncbi:MAG TPA: hypothetical protein VK614_02310 [Allosphingosinicella sp.]|nr:hypothetical protein [Allosphingosinicella sp.]